MPFELLGNLRQRTIDAMPNWNRIQTLIPSTIPLELLEYAQTHESTRAKISFAEYHFYVLNQLYMPDSTTRETDTADWVNAELHSIVFSLYSSLDSLLHEINLAYQFGIGVSGVNTYHNHERFDGDCVRCRLSQADDHLASYLDGELAQEWFSLFHGLRNQIVHKNIPVVMVHVRVSEPPNPRDSTTRIILPNDPTNTNPQYQDYSMNLEANQYCRESIDRVRRLVEAVYPFIEGRVKSIYNLT